MHRTNYILVLLVLISIGSYQALGCPTIGTTPATYVRVVGNVATISVVVDPFTVSSETTCAAGMALQTSFPFHFTSAQMAIIDTNTGMPIRAVPEGISEMFEGDDDAFNAVTNAAGGSVLDGVSATFSPFSPITLGPFEALALEYSGVIGPEDPEPSAGISVSFAAGPIDNVQFSNAQLVDIPLIDEEDDDDVGLLGFSHHKKCRLRIKKSGLKLKCKGDCPQTKTCTKVIDFKVKKKVCDKLDGICIPDKWRRKYEKKCKICIFCKCKRVGGKGDPHFIGFNGHHFDFMGRAGEVFNLITDTGFTVNSLFVNADLRPQKTKTYMGSIGVVMGADNQLEVACDRVRNKRVVVIHGSELPSESRLVLPNNGYIERGVDDVVVVHTTRWELKIRFSSSNHSTCHLNFASKYNKGSSAVQPTGVLGNTLDDRFVPTQDEILKLTDTFVVYDGLFGTKSEQNVYFSSQVVDSASVENETEGSIWLVSLSSDK